MFFLNKYLYISNVMKNEEVKKKKSKIKIKKSKCIIMKEIRSERNISL